MRHAGRLTQFGTTAGALWGILLLAAAGCSAPPDLTGYAVNTPEYYHENKAFFTARLSSEEQTTAAEVRLEHLYEVSASDARSGDVVRHNDPISIALQGVRLPEELPGGTRDIAVILTIHTSVDKGATELLAFYQRDVSPGQLLNFNNLLVYADPMWDSASPPYFRLKVLDVKAERNRRTGAVLSRVSNLSAEIGGMVPHPVIPIVTTAIDVAALVLSNQQNEVLLDYQIQFYGQEHRDNAGGATLGALVAGQWIIVGRGRNEDSTFWRKPLWLDRKTDQLLTTPATSRNSTKKTNVPVPYVSVVVIRADAQVPKLVADRSEALLSLLSTPSGKSDIDAVEAAADGLMSAINAFTVERRLRKYRSIEDIDQIIAQLKTHETKPHLNLAELRRLTYVLDQLTGRSLGIVKTSDWITWWNKVGQTTAEWEFVEDASAPFGIIFRKKRTADDSM